MRITQIGIPGQQIFVLIDFRAESDWRNLPTRSKKSERRLQRHAADPEIRRHHALAADRLEQAQDVFALAEAVQEDRHRAHVHGMRSQPDQVRVDAGQFVHQYPQPLRFRRNFQPEQFFDRQHVAEIVGHRAQVVDAVGQRHYLLIKLGFAGLLNAGVQKSDVGHDAHNIFAIDLQHQAQHAVRRRMLRAHVQDHGFVLTGFERGMVEVRWCHLAVALHRIVFAQRVAFPIFGHQQAA